MYANTHILEFDKIKDQVRRYARSLQGKARVDALVPSNNELEVRRWLDETHHALTILLRYQDPPFGGLRDVTETLQRARIHASLRPSAFLDVIGLIEATHNNVRFFEQVQEHDIEGDALTSYYEQLTVTPALKQAIEQVITIDGDIHDRASNELARIRGQIQHNEQKVTEKLNHLLQTQKNRLTEQLVTLRNNRYVVPVKQSDKNRFPGTVIDYSSSGETVFMEPTAVQDINNRIALLQLEEEREIERILRELTTQVAQYHDILHANFDLLSELDMIFAKASHAREFEATRPELTDQVIELRHARHPLISKDEVVANTIAFRPNQKIIIITGPNTGGKTVALKTMGLLSIMVQSGLLIPVAEQSKTVLFEHIFADIGDEQSIEQSLSTFSSHMTRIIDILAKMTVGSLILLDELGSGTDPKEGAGLAISLLEHLRIRGVHVMATTHYPELKAYAYDKDEIVNASVEFDIDTLRPTYRLLLGTPGQSNALHIAERLGLREDIVEAARSHVVTAQDDVAVLIRKLEDQGRELDQRITTFERRNKELEEQQVQLRQTERQLMEEKQKYNRKVSLEQSRILQETRAQADELLKEIEALKERKDIKEHELAELKFRTRQLGPKESTTSSTTDHVYQAGDLVNVLKFHRTGELIKQLSNGQWQVKMGILTSQFDESELEFIEQKAPVEAPRGGVKSVKKAAKAELDLRGKRYEEAKVELDRYIDDCIVANQPYATIIHGFGTLTLRNLVKRYLDQHPQVASHRDGEGNEGGQGVTVVHFK